MQWVSTALAIVVLWGFSIAGLVEPADLYSEAGEWKTWVTQNFTWLYIAAFVRLPPDHEYRYLLGFPEPTPRARLAPRPASTARSHSRARSDAIGAIAIDASPRSRDRRPTRDAHPRAREATSFVSR